MAAPVYLVWRGAVASSKASGVKDHRHVDKPPSQGRLGPGVQAYMIHLLYALLRRLPIKRRTRLHRSLQRLGLEQRLIAHGEVVYRHDGREVGVDLADHVGREMFKHGWYEPAYVAFIRDHLASKQGIFLDVGANVGNYSLALADHFASTLAFEPNPSVFATLKANCARNPELDIRPLQYGLSSSSATLEFYPAQGDNSGESSLERPSYDAASIQVDVRPGDEFATADKPVSAIKIDVEGHELAVLEGLATTLARDRPSIFMEWHTEHMDTKGGLEALYAALPEGYVVLHSDNRHKTVLETLEPPLKPKYNLIFCLPEARARALAEHETRH